MTPTTLTPHVRQEHREHLLNYIRARVDDRDAAEDIAQEVLLKMWKNRDRLRDPERLLPWMYAITRNAIIDAHRAASVRRTDRIDAEEIPFTEEESATAEREMAGCLAPMIATMPEKYRSAVTEADIEGRPQAEIAARHGISLSGAKSRVQRGRDMLAAMVLECCKVEFDARGHVREFGAREECRGECR